MKQPAAVAVIAQAAFFAMYAFSRLNSNMDGPSIPLAFFSVAVILVWLVAAEGLWSDTESGVCLASIAIVVLGDLLCSLWLLSRIATAGPVDGLLGVLALPLLFLPVLESFRQLRSSLGK